MGWYHVDREGKGFCLGDETALKFNMEELSKYLPDKSETENVLRRIAKDAVDTYDEWPLLWKFAALDSKSAWDWDGGNMEYFESSKNSILANTMHYCFEKCYGYPMGSFVSVSDYDGNVMIFCHSKWPPKVYNQALAELTEEKLAKQLKEFLTNIMVGDDLDDFELEWCEEYIKE